MIEEKDAFAAKQLPNRFTPLAFRFADVSNFCADVVTRRDAQVDPVSILQKKPSRQYRIRAY